jgi:hypothetical protein
MSKAKTTKFALDLQAHYDKLSKSHELYEAGEIGHEMGKQYMKELISMVESHKNLQGSYYILALHSQSFLNPAAQNLTFCSMRSKPNPAISTDLWHYSNDTCDLKLIWTLPSYEMWTDVFLSPHTDPFLKECMSKFMDGTLEKENLKVG